MSPSRNISQNEVCLKDNCRHAASKSDIYNKLVKLIDLLLDESNFDDCLGTSTLLY